MRRFQVHGRELLMAALVALLAASPASAVDPMVLGAYGVIGAVRSFLRDDPKPEPKAPARVHTGMDEGRISSRYEAGFGRDREGIVLGAVRNARKSVLVAASRPIPENVVKGLTSALSRGTKVMAVADVRVRGMTRLARAGIPVRLLDGGVPEGFIVMDMENLVSGNLFLRDAKPLAGTYAREWKELWDAGKPLVPKR